jgi:hypothetical protein
MRQPRTKNKSLIVNLNDFVKEYKELIGIVLTIISSIIIPFLLAYYLKG